MPTPLSCVLIADDLTGACDAAVHFALRGAPAVVHLDFQAHLFAGQHPARVDAFNTETRDAGPAEIEQRIRRVADLTAAAKPGIIFKKIDSLLRGNPGREVMVAMDAFGCDAAIVTPAFPEMGRTVRDGHLEVHGDNEWQRLEVAALLRAQGLEECAHTKAGTLAAAMAQGARYVSVDVHTHADLERVVTEARSTGKNILWAGSGGLASALAGAIFSGPIAREPHRPGVLPVLFGIGTNHPVTAAQIAALRKERPACDIHANSGDADGLSRALDEGRHVILRLPRDQTPNAELRNLLQGIAGRAGAIVLSGGDTAASVCHAMEARAIEMGDQIVPGLPWGILRGGLLDGIPIATKSGAFGRKTDLIEVADFFTCPKT